MQKMQHGSFSCKKYKNCPVMSLLFKTLENNEDLGILIYKHNRLLYVNQTFMDITEYNKPELLNKDFINFIHPIDRNFLKDIHHKRLTVENVPENYKVHIIKKSGRVGLIEINIINPPVKLNGEKLILATVREIDRNIFTFKL